VLIVLLTVVLIVLLSAEFCSVNCDALAKFSLTLLLLLVLLLVLLLL
jgi:hypothetical protein